MSRTTDSLPFYSRDVDSARQYWLKAFSANPGASLIPADRMRGSGEAVAEPHRVSISGKAFETLTKMTARTPLLLYVTLVAVVKICLYKYSRSRAITVGAPPRGVEIETPESFQPLAIADSIDGEMSFRALLLNIKETVVEAYQYQDYLFGAFADEREAGE